MFLAKIFYLSTQSSYILIDSRAHARQSFLRAKAEETTLALPSAVSHVMLIYNVFNSPQAFVHENYNFFFSRDGITGRVKSKVWCYSVWNFVGLSCLRDSYILFKYKVRSCTHCKSTYFFHEFELGKSKFEGPFVIQLKMNTKLTHINKFVL